MEHGTGHLNKSSKKSKFGTAVDFVKSNKNLLASGASTALDLGMQAAMMYMMFRGGGGEGASQVVNVNTPEIPVTPDTNTGAASNIQY